MDHTYKVIELVGSSHEGVEAAVENAVARASKSLKGIDWVEVREVRGHVKDGKVDWYQVKLGLGFRVMDAMEIRHD